MEMEEQKTLHEEQDLEISCEEEEKQLKEEEIPKTEKEQYEAIAERLMSNAFTTEQIAEVKRAMAVKVPYDVILGYLRPEVPVTEMMEIRRKYEET